MEERKRGRDRDRDRRERNRGREWKHVEYITPDKKIERRMIQRREGIHTMRVVTETFIG